MRIRTDPGSTNDDPETARREPETHRREVRREGTTLEHLVTWEAKVTGDRINVRSRLNQHW